MQWHKHLSGKLAFGKTALATGVLGAFFLFVGAPTLKANPQDCYGRLQRAEWQLNNAIERHGYNSRQADHQRHELREAQDRCWREQQNQSYEWRQNDRYRDSNNYGYSRDDRYYQDQNQGYYRGNRRNHRDEDDDRD